MASVFANGSTGPFRPNVDSWRPAVLLCAAAPWSDALSEELSCARTRCSSLRHRSSSLSPVRIVPARRSLPRRRRAMPIRRRATLSLRRVRPNLLRDIRPRAMRPAMRPRRRHIRLLPRSIPRRLPLPHIRRCRCRRLRRLPCLRVHPLPPQAGPWRRRGYWRSLARATLRVACTVATPNMGNAHFPASPPPPIALPRASA